MDTRDIIILLIQGVMMAIVFSIGLQGSLLNLSYIAKRPGLFFRGVVAVNVIVPAVAIALCSIFPIAPATKTGIVVMAISPLAPFALGKMLKTGAGHSYAIGLYVALMLASVILVPVSVALLAAFLGRDYAVPPSVLANFVATSILLPLAAGFLIAWLWPKVAAWASPIISKIGTILLIPILLLLLYKFGAQMLALMGDGTLLVIAATIASGFLAGHLLGGPEPEYRLALAEAAATRHPGMAAALIASLHFSDPDVIVTILLFLFTGILVSTICARWLASRYNARKPAPEPG